MLWYVCQVPSNGLACEYLTDSGVLMIQDLTHAENYKNQRGNSIMTIRPVLVLFLVSLLVTTGCTVVHTSQLAARKGDTVIVSIFIPGVIDTNKIHDNLIIAQLPG